MMMLTLEEVRRRLADRNLSAVSRMIGMPYSTLYAVASGREEKPTYATVKALSDYLTATTPGGENGNH